HVRVELRAWLFGIFEAALILFDLLVDIDNAGDGYNKFRLRFGVAGTRTHGALHRFRLAESASWIGRAECRARRRSSRAEVFLILVRKPRSATSRKRSGGW